jgi:hypothetical protein
MKQPTLQRWNLMDISVADTHPAGLRLSMIDRDDVLYSYLSRSFGQQFLRLSNDDER